jgi:hypothetical protein
MHFNISGDSTASNCLHPFRLGFDVQPAQMLSGAVPDRIVMTTSATLNHGNSRIDLIILHLESASINYGALPVVHTGK